MKRAGFTLMELLVYLALFAFLAQLLFSSAAQIMTTMVSEDGVLLRSSNAVMTCDVLVRDLRRAGCARTDWKKITPHECIWHCPLKNKDIGWCVDNGRLLRMLGTYDAPQGAWTQRRRDVALHQAEEITFEVVQEKNLVRGAQVSITVRNGTKKLTLHQWVALRERVWS